MQGDQPCNERRLGAESERGGHAAHDGEHAARDQEAGYEEVMAHDANPFRLAL
jgi:hypothetical protein